uniref:C3H1-type domain-containing protein n=1 Tax=Acrobeloides nanus TaxID=290746 RepID=A0A914DHE8_9BILA
MPPKKTSAPSKKTEEKKKDKIVEDKTFGLKKTRKNLKFIQQVQHQVKGGGQTKEKLDAQKFEASKKKEKDDLTDLNKLFKPVQSLPKVDKDVDPKSVLCVFFKQGLCQKGNKCKYSHDLSMQQKTAKRNIYVDSRDVKTDENETNENWDEEKLVEVAEKKHGEKDRKRPNQTEIVCKYFIEAVENNKYGWFWECPNGGTCIYRHALPPGYVLSKDKKKLEEMKKLETISLEELIEKERATLSSNNLTKVTLESFIEWKKRKIRERKQKQLAEEKKKQTNYKLGRQLGLSGRELFTFNPDLVAEDDEEAGDVEYEKETDQNEDEVKAFDIDERMFLNLGEDGKMLDEDLGDIEEEPEADQNGKGEAEEGPGPSKPIVFDENLFEDEDIPSDEDDDEDEAEEDDDDSPPNVSKLKI